MVIWYDILFAVNLVSKHLQSKDMQLDVALTLVKGLIDFLQKFRATGFMSAKVTATEIALELEVEPKFRIKRDKRKPKDTDISPEKKFETDYFLVIIDKALVSLNSRFQQMQDFQDKFGFLFNVAKLCVMTDEEMKDHCMKLSLALSDGLKHDIDGCDLFSELKVMREMIPQKTNTALEALQFLKSVEGTFPNAEVAYRILLTIPVTVASGERSFSKLKLIKNYLRTTMSQERLCGLAMLSIERDVASDLDYGNLMMEFAVRKARKIPL